MPITPVGDLNQSSEKEVFSFSDNTYESLKRWIHSEKKIIFKYLPNLSPNAYQFVSNHFSDTENVRRTEEAHTLLICFQNVEPLKRLGLMEAVSNGVEKHRNAFVDIECVEYGVDIVIANERVTLLVNLFKYFSNFLETEEVSGLEQKENFTKVHVASCNYDSAFFNLFGLVAQAFLENSTDFVFDVDNSKLFSTLLFYQILVENGVSAKLSSEDRSEGLLPFTRTFTGKEVPMIIFSSTDINAALDASVSAACFNHGLVSWATTTILVQESIFDHFVDNLKIKLNKTMVSDMSPKPYIDDDTKENLRIIAAEAKAKGMQVFQAEGKEIKNFVPTLIIGDYVSCPVVSTYATEDRPLPVIFLISFRSIEEGIAKANQSPNKLAASVWSEVHSTCMLASSKLDFGTVWINSIGVFHAAVPFFKQTTGFQPNAPFGKAVISVNKCRLRPNFLLKNIFYDKIFYSSDDLEKILNNSYKTYQTWKKTDLYTKIRIINKMWNGSSELSKFTCIKTKENIIETVRNLDSDNRFFKFDHFTVSSTTEPVGIVIFSVSNYEPEKDNQHLFKYVLYAAFLNNVVIVTCDTKCSISAPFLPDNVVFVTQKYHPKDEIIRLLRNNKLMTKVSAWDCDFKSESVQCLLESGKCTLFDMHFDIRLHLVKRKTLWTPIGQ